MATQDDLPHDLELLSTTQVCDLLNVSDDFIRKQVQLGRLPALRLGKNLRFRVQDVRSFVNAAEIPSLVQPRPVGITRARGRDELSAHHDHLNVQP